MGTPETSREPCPDWILPQKEDPWNSIMTGAFTGGFLQMRQGLGPAGRSALFGGVLLAMIEGAGIMLNKLMSVQQMPVMIEEPAPNVPGGFLMPNQSQSLLEAESSSSSSWFGGLFEGKKEEETKPSGGVEAKVLESFDSPMPPTFEYK